MRKEGREGEGGESLGEMKLARLRVEGAGHRAFDGEAAKTDGEACE